MSYTPPDYDNVGLSFQGRDVYTPVVAAGVSFGSGLFQPTAEVNFSFVGLAAYTPPPSDVMSFASLRLALVKAFSVTGWLVGRLKRWDGALWSSHPLRIHDGAAWKRIA